MTDYTRHEHHDFLAASAQALDDPTLQGALTRLATTLMAANRRGYAALADSDRLRDHAKQIKQHALANLDRYLQQLETSVQRLGGHVHWAAERCRGGMRIIADIANQAGCKRAVKSKSMTSEEIHLNAALEAAGIDVTETDFGEYILQVAGERPSHIVAPAVHHTRETIARVLSERLGEKLSDDPKTAAGSNQDQLALCRGFAEACDLGITGANFAVAETGTVVLVTNEGNGRLTTTCPRVHIALMGIEKVIPRLCDLPVFLKLLARAATGQTLSVYTSLDRGPHPCPGRSRWAGGVSSRLARQRPIESAGDSLSREPGVHTLRRLSERLPGLPSHRRSCLRRRLLRPDRQHFDTALRQRQRESTPAARLFPVRCVPGGLPRAYQYPAHADWATRAAAPRGQKSLGKAGLCACARTSVAAAMALSPGIADGAVGVAAVGQKGLVGSFARPRRRMDQCARFSRSGSTVLSGKVEWLMTTSRDALLQRVRQAVAQGNRAGTIPALPVRGTVGYQGAGIDPVKRFCDELTAAGGRPFTLPSDFAAAVVHALNSSKAQGTRPAAVDWSRAGY